MLAGQRTTFGQRIPDSLHAVSVSMPTIDDIIAYEERRPSAMERLSSGYPRFVANPCLKAIEAHWQDLFAKPGLPIWLTSSESMAKRLQEHLACPESKFIRHRGVCGVRLPADPALNRAAKLFLQHVGGLLSSRQAEDYLVAEGLKDAIDPEQCFDGDALAHVQQRLGPLVDAPDSDSLVLAPCGMNAAYAVIQAIGALQSAKGRHSWIKLGWLYADTMHILDKLSLAGASNEEILNVFDLSQLEALLENRGGEIAAILTEAPTNPLIQTMDLERIHQLARAKGVYLVVDPTVQSPYNVNVAPVSDVIALSLTKYFAHAGDVMFGAIAVSKNCPNREALLQAIRDQVEPVYGRDLSRLAFQMDSARAYVEQSNASAAQVIAFLEDHPKVRRVFSALEPSSRENYLKIARTPESIGALLSFEYDGPVAEFYDRLAVPKGPSFGTDFTLICPFLYLAHYELVSTPEGRAKLERAGISPELIRMSVGAEPADEIIAALADALG